MGYAAETIFFHFRNAWRQQWTAQRLLNSMFANSMDSTSSLGRKILLRINCVWPFQWLKTKAIFPFGFSIWMHLNGDEAENTSELKGKEENKHSCLKIVSWSQININCMYLQFLVLRFGTWNLSLFHNDFCVRSKITFHVHYAISSKIHVYYNSSVFGCAYFVRIHTRNVVSSITL